MSWVPLVTVEEATSETKNIYDFLQNKWGFVPNYYQALGPYPQLLKDQVDMFTHVMFVPPYSLFADAQAHQSARSEAPRGRRDLRLPETPGG
jgi:hypothetical protein